MPLDVCVGPVKEFGETKSMLLWKEGIACHMFNHDNNKQIHATLKEDIKSIEKKIIKKSN